MKNNFAHCLTTISYSAWVLGAFCLNFYSILLPKIPINDYIHYQNYFLMTTIVVIALQEINYKRLKLKQQLPIKTFSMQQFTSDKSHVKIPVQNLRFVDNAFEESRNATFGGLPQYKSTTNLSINGEEDVSFDISQFNTYNSNKDNHKNLLNVPPEMDLHETDLTVQRTGSTFENFIDNNQTVFVYILVFLLVLQYLASTVILFKSVTYSHYLFVTPLIHPLNILIYLVFTNYSCKMPW